MSRELLRKALVPCSLIVALVAGSTASHGQIDSQTGNQRQPSTIYELVDAFNYTFEQILGPHELAIVRSSSPEEIREESEEVYQKISQNVKRWTEDWIAYAEQYLETVPPERLEQARDSAKRVDEILRQFFESKGLPYRTMGVVFLPQRLFHDERRRYGRTRGVFIPFYPEVFFATIDPSSPMELVLVHESIHFNKTGRAFGSPLLEGITEMAARRIVREHGLVASAQLRREPYYEKERQIVEFLSAKIAEKGGKTTDAGFDMLLRAYLTGDQRPLHELFGITWERVVALSHTRKWRKSTIVNELKQQ